MRSPRRLPGLKSVTHLHNIRHVPIAYIVKTTQRIQRIQNAKRIFDERSSTPRNAAQLDDEPQFHLPAYVRNPYEGILVSSRKETENTQKDHQQAPEIPHNAQVPITVRSRTRGFARSKVHGASRPREPSTARRQKESAEALEASAQHKCQIHTVCPEIQCSDAVRPRRPPAVNPNRPRRSAASHDEPSSESMPLPFFLPETARESREFVPHLPTKAVSSKVAPRALLWINPLTARPTQGRIQEFDFSLM